MYYSVSPQAPPVEPSCADSDKVVHLIAYFIMGLAGYAFFRVCSIRIASKPMVYSLIFGSLYGFFIEVVQYFLPTRVFSFYDIMANEAGLFLSMFFIWMFNITLKQM